MGLQKPGITLAERCAGYAKACGILCTKPVRVPNIERLRYARGLTEDVVQLSENNAGKLFSSLEKNIINEIKSGKIETAKIIDKSGNLVKDLEFIGDRYSVRISPECIYKDGIMDKFIDATYIHNHPFNVPLSSNDIYQMAALKLKKMVACTSDGGYSLMQRLKPISEMNYDEFVIAAGRLNSEEIQQIKSLGKIRGLTDIQRMELLNKWRYERFNAFADEFGLKFKSDINAISSKNSNIDGNLFFVNPLQRLIDNIIIKYHNIAF